MKLTEIYNFYSYKIVLKISCLRLDYNKGALIENSGSYSDFQ